MSKKEEEIILSLRNMLNHLIIHYGKGMLDFDRFNITKRIEQADKLLQRKK